MAQHLGGRALRDLLAEVEHGDPVGHVLHQSHVVVDQEDGEAVAAAQPLQQRRPAPASRSGSIPPPARREQQLRVPGQRAGDLHQPLVAVGQVLRTIDLAPCRASPTNSSADSARSRSASSPGAIGLFVALRADHHVLERGQRREQADVLERAAHARAGALVRRFIA